MSLLVLWDVDYTLVNAHGLGTRLYQEVFGEMFGRELTVIAPKAGRTDRAIVLDTLTLAGIADPRAHVDPFLAALAKHIATLNGSAGPPAPPAAPVEALPGAAAALAALHGRAHQSVLTGNIRPLAELKLRTAGLDTHLDLDAGAYGDVHEIRAELVDVARQAAKARYGVDFPGGSTILIGDTPLDVEAALARGARAIAVATGSYAQSELADAHATLPDLTDTAALLSALAP